MQHISGQEERDRLDRQATLLNQQNAWTFIIVVRALFQPQNAKFIVLGLLFNTFLLAGVVTSIFSVIWTAKHAISTVSFGVLQKHHSALSMPDLPSKQKSAIFMANLSHVLNQFPNVWWDNSIPVWLEATLSRPGCLVLAA